MVFLKPGVLPPDWGWRAAFGIGAVLGLAILLLRRWIPESPRWLVLHNRLDEAEAVMAGIEKHIAGHPLPRPTERIRLAVSSRNSMVATVLAVVRQYPRRAVLGFVLMGTQAFFYNAIFFSYALVLTRFFKVPSGLIGWYILPFALGNFAGPLLLGPLFDTIGRKPMIAFTYAISGVLLAIVGYLFREDVLGAAALTACWTGIFFFASAAASSAYLTVRRKLSLKKRPPNVRFLLRDRHRERRRGGALSVRGADRHRRAGQRLSRLPVRRGIDDRRGGGRAVDRGQGRTSALGKRRPAAFHPRFVKVTASGSR